MPKIHHYPRLDTILNVEKVIKNAKEPLSKNEIERRLKKKTMRSTLNLILGYLEENGRIALLKEGVVMLRRGEELKPLKKEKPDYKKIKPVILRILRRNGVAKASIFGSFARGEAEKGSDIDLLIEFKGRKSLFDLVRVERELESALNKKVDLLTYNSINPLLKNRILKDEVRIM